MRTKKMDLNEIGYLVHRTSKDKGFYDADLDVNFILSKLALIHSEVTETLEAVRKDHGEDKIMEEVADVFIRLVDFVEALKEGGYVSKDLLLHDVILAKMKANMERPQRHGVLA